MLTIIERHFQLVDELDGQPGFDRAAARAFLLQTLAPLNVASRGFLDGTKRYEEQRARADDLADRDEFRNAVVNSLQEGFFVSDKSGAITEFNDAFAKLTGYPAEGLPYRWPYPWLVDEKAAWQQQSRLGQENQVQYETPIRHRDGRLVWVAANINKVNADAADGDVYVGTLRDITAERAFAARESAVLRLATAVSVAKSMSEVLVDHPRRVPTRSRRAPGGGGGVADQWRRADHPGGRTERARRTGVTSIRSLREIFQQARRQLPLTVQPVEYPDAPGQSSGIVAVLTGSGDVALWMELRVPRRVSGEDRLLVTVLVGHLGLAIQHVRQFEAARETSLTLAARDAGAHRATARFRGSLRARDSAPGDRRRLVRRAARRRSPDRHHRRGLCGARPRRCRGDGSTAQLRTGAAAHRRRTRDAARRARRGGRADPRCVLHHCFSGHPRHRVG